MKRLLKWIAGVLAVLLLAAFGVLCYMAGSPKDAYGMVRYALPHMHRGTLTDGSVTLASTPDNHALEVKTFDAHDGQGLSLAVTAGLRTGVITGRGSPALRRRCKELDIEFVYEKQGHKIAAYEDVLRKTGAKESEVAYLGDDLPDLTIMRRVGLAVAVGNAAPEVKRAADYRTKADGGKGAARELVELILKSKGIWEEMIDKARA